jgi:hypothetical protein
LSTTERSGLVALLDDAFPFRDALATARSIHVHLRLEDLATLPVAVRRWGTIENERSGYLKIACDGGVNVIVSSIDVAEEDRLAPRAPRPHLDHVGVDLREITPASRVLFDAAPARARSLGWGHVAQGGPGAPVRCCHTSVAEKHWLFPRGSAFARPLELALGPLVLSEGGQGEDLRPMDPADPRARPVACCAPTSPVVSLGKKR